MHHDQDEMPFSKKEQLLAEGKFDMLTKKDSN